MIIKAEILFDFDEQFIEYHRETSDDRNPPQIILDMITEELSDKGVKIIMAEANEAGGICSK